jgi:hypothetical protein
MILAATGGRFRTAPVFRPAGISRSWQCACAGPSSVRRPDVAWWRSKREEWGDRATTRVAGRGVQCSDGVHLFPHWCVAEASPRLARCINSSVSLSEGIMEAPPLLLILSGRGESNRAFPRISGVVTEPLGSMHLRQH